MEQNNTEFGYVKDGQVWLKAQGTLPERALGEVKESEEEALQYFADRFKLVEQKVDELQKQIEENQNKGSFLVKLRHLRDQFSEFDALGDYQPLIEKLNLLEKELEDYIEQNRSKNLTFKKALIEELEVAVKNPNWKEATELVKDIRQRWIRTGAVADELKEEIEGRFQGMVDDFFERRQQFFDQKQAMIGDRIKAYEALIEKAEALDKSAENAQEQVQQLINDWKEVDNVPKTQYEELLARFRKALPGQSGAGRKNGKPGAPQAMADPEKLKALMAEAGTLMELPIEEAVQKAKDLQQAWKEAGKVGKEQRDLRHDFRMAIDLIFERRFIEDLAQKKNRKGNEADLKGLQVKLLKDLLYRDKRELATFEENLGRFNLGTQSADKLVDKNLAQQKHKIAVKAELLQRWQGKSKK